jgi:hypothetical protein
LTKFTFRDRLTQEHPECVDPTVAGGCYGCPFSWGYEERPPAICNEETLANCEDCWDRECPKPLSCRDRLKKEHPENINLEFFGGCLSCPDEYGYISEDKVRCDGLLRRPCQETCTACWDQPAKSV